MSVRVIHVTRETARLGCKDAGHAIPFLPPRCVRGYPPEADSLGWRHSQALMGLRCRRDSEGSTPRLLWAWVAGEKLFKNSASLYLAHTSCIGRLHAPLRRTAGETNFSTSRFYILACWFIDRTHTRLSISRGSARTGVGGRFAADQSTWRELQWKQRAVQCSRADPTRDCQLATGNWRLLTGYW